MEKQVAILIDGDNISHKYAGHIKQEAMNYGNIKIFRLYGSVNSPSVKSWYKVMPLQGIVPVLQISYANGKSIADQSLTIDAIDLLYTNELDVFCIVSSDSDYVKLVYRLKEAGKLVIGMGEKKTREAMAKACDEFKILDLIFKDVDDVEKIENENILEIENFGSGEESVQNVETVEEEEIDGMEDAEISISPEDEIIDDIREFIELSDDDRINLSTIGVYLTKKYLGFDARNYGHKNMTKMIENHKDKLDVKVNKVNAPDGVHKIVYVDKKKHDNN